MKVSLGERIFGVLNIIFMLLFAVVMLYPYLNQLAVSLNDGMDSALGGITIFPRVFTLENYKSVLINPKIPRAFFVSVSKVILNVVIGIVVSFSAAYALTRKSFKLRRHITRYFAVTMYISAGVVPNYLLYRTLGLINNFWVYILPFTFSFYNMIIIRSFIQELPGSLEESALIDGANEIVVMFKIIIPLSKPVLATVALWIAVGQWNEYSQTLYYITDRSLYSLQYLMMSILKQNETLSKAISEAAALGGLAETSNQPTSESIKAAMFIITTLPIICVYPFMQKYFIKGMTLGAVKE